MNLFIDFKGNVFQVDCMINTDSRGRTYIVLSLLTQYEWVIFVCLLCKARKVSEKSDNVPLLQCLFSKATDSGCA